MAEVNILVVENDPASQQALKNLLDSEGWRVRAVSAASEVLNELARGIWHLAIVNAGLTDTAGPVFAILRDLALAEPEAEAAEQEAVHQEGRFQHGLLADSSPAPQTSRRLRVLFLLAPAVAGRFQPVLEREALPYIVKPYNLNELLEKVSDLLLEAGAIDSPIRAIREFAPRTRRILRRPRRDSRTGAMFASREDYQMTEEEMAEWERQEEEERKKRRKKDADRERLG